MALIKLTHGPLEVLHGKSAHSAGRPADSHLAMHQYFAPTTQTLLKGNKYFSKSCLYHEENCNYE